MTFAKELVVNIRSILMATVIIASTHASVAGAAGIRGYVDAVVKNADGSATIRGWACDHGVSKSIAVHAYIGGPAGIGKFFTAVTANSGNEPAVNSACGTAGVSHRFTITMAKDSVNQLGGQFVWIHGISATGGPNLTLEHSGRYPIQRNDLPAVVQTCGDSVYQALFSASGAPVYVNCHLTLKPTDYVRNLVVVSGYTHGSNINITCNGAVLSKGLLITSAKLTNATTGTPDWKAPQNVKVSGCTTEGLVRVSGMAVNGEDTNLTWSSRNAYHTERAQFYAPSNITFSNMKFQAQNSIQMYLSPGVHHVTVQNSAFAGTSKSVALYMDAESGFNKLLNNNFSTATEARELVAIDASASNAITGNHFAALNHGGIYLYRNCGEGGNIRHQTSNFNMISNNHFYYRYYRGPNPSVWIASRNGNRSYCDKDAGYPYGSSANNRDLAMFNTVKDNTYDAWFSVRVDEVNNTVANNVMTGTGF